MMFDLIKLKEQLTKAKKALDHWKMHGTDTPYLTYHEQLELYQIRVDRLKKKVKELK